MASKIIRIPIEKEKERWAGLFDIHVPETDWKAWGACRSYLGSRSWDGVVLGGDICTFKSICHHEKGVLRKIEGKRLEKDFVALEGILEEIRDTVGANKKYAYILGNHEDWLNRYLDEHPELEGLPSFDLVGRIRKIIPQCVWVPQWTKGNVLSIGKANFIHGPRRGRGCSKVLSDYGGNTFFGHEHHDNYISHSTLEDNETRGAQCCGCFQDPRVEYMKGAPTRQVHGFAEFEFFKNGYFSYRIHKIFNGKFMMDGKVYKG